MSARQDRLTFYKDAADQWRWQYVRSNGRILADSSQGYSRLIDAKKGAARVVGLCTLNDGLHRYDEPVLVEVER